MIEAILSISPLSPYAPPPPVRRGPLIVSEAYSDGSWSWGAVYWLPIGPFVAVWRGGRGAVFLSRLRAAEWGMSV